MLDLVRSPPIPGAQNLAKSDPLYITQMPPKTSRTEGFSGSDLQELYRNAAMVPVKEFMRSPEGPLPVLVTDLSNSSIQWS